MICSGCGKENKNTARYCAYCGTALTPVAPHVQEQSAQVDADTEVQQEQTAGTSPVQELSQGQQPDSSVAQESSQDEARRRAQEMEDYCPSLPASFPPASTFIMGAGYALMFLSMLLPLFTDSIDGHSVNYSQLSQLYKDLSFGRSETTDADILLIIMIVLLLQTLCIILLKRSGGRNTTIAVAVASAQIVGTLILLLYARGVEETSHLVAGVFSPYVTIMAAVVILIGTCLRY